MQPCFLNSFFLNNYKLFAVWWNKLETIKLKNTLQWWVLQIQSTVLCTFLPINQIWSTVMESSIKKSKTITWVKTTRLLFFSAQKHKEFKHPAFTGHNAAPHKIESETNYSHLGWSRLLRWDILWIGFTFTESWWEDKVTECTSSHLKYRHESRTGVSWVYPSCQSINDNYWARTPVGGERRNEIDHGGARQGMGRIMEIGK